MNHPAVKTVRFYVALDGDDRWSGKSACPGRNDGPFATLTRARDAIRELKSKRGLQQPVVVAIRGGAYNLKDPLCFTPADSGTLLCPVLYTAYRNERVVISGGRRITGWTRAETGLWVADVSALQRRGVQARQLFVNGRRAQRARQPFSGFFRVAEELADNGSEWRFRCDRGDLKSHWATGDTEIVIPQQWHAARHNVLSIDDAGRIVTVAGASNWRVKHANYWLENCPGGLHVPGSWLWSRSREQLFYRPVRGEDPNAVEMIVPCLETLVRFDGDQAGQDTIRHITLAGLEFHHSAWDMGADGYRDRQAAYGIRAAVWIDGAESCMVKRCRFVHLGNYALEWGSGCRKNEVRECEITDVGGGGIKIGLPGARQGSTRAVTSGTVVADNHIHDIGVVYPGAVGIWMGQSHGNRIIHNHIHDTYSTGISVGWTWGYNPTNAHHNTIAFNHVHHIGRGAILNDMGAIYTLGSQPGTVIHHNLVHDVLPAENGYTRHGIYLDEGSSFIVCENNVVYRTQSGGFVQHYGRDNIIRNNVFALADEAQVRLTKAEGHRSFRFERNIVLYRELPMEGIGGAGDCGLDYNLYWRRNPSKHGTFQFLNVWLALRSFATTLIAEAPRYDTVVVRPEDAGPTASANPESRSLGAVPAVTRGRAFPDAAAWDAALILPPLVTCTGNPPVVARQAETECRMMQDGTALFVRIHCRHSNRAFPRAGRQEERPEFVDLYLKPDIRGERVVQFLVRANGVRETYYHRAGGAKNTVTWSARIERTRTGWMTIIRVPFKSIRAWCGRCTPAWGLFIARNATLPPLRFSEWQETGADRHSLLADPLFVNEEKGNFQLRRNSPAFALGFAPIDLSTVGVRQRSRGRKA